MRRKRIEVPIKHRRQRGWPGWGLWILGALLTIGFFLELPELRRYMRASRM